MKFAEVVAVSQRVADTSRRLAKVEAISDLLRRLAPDEVEIVVNYLSGQTRQGKLGTGYAALKNSESSEAAEPQLEVLEVDRALDELASVKGQGSAKKRGDILAALFKKAMQQEQHFLVRLIIGELRQGALEGVMADAVAKAASVPLATVQRAAMMAGDIAVVAKAAIAQGEAGLHQYDIQLFRPVQPMLAQTAEDMEAAITDLGEAALEYKMDGARVQVHRSGDEVRVFSRLLNDVTPAVPEIVTAARALPASEFILDGEVISLRRDGRPNPFQITMRRFGRKINADELRGELPLTPFWFDVLRLEGGSLLDEIQARRFEALKQLAPASIIPSIVTNDAARAEDFLQAALGQGHEGVMAKSTTAVYAAGSRGQSWLKIKKAHTLDLVILAAEWGHGRRKGWLSNLHLGALDTASGQYIMLGKTFKGLTDAMLAWQTEELLKRERERDTYTVYVRPEIVVEIAFSDLQASPRYPGGLALRFARVKRFRTDKTPADADTFATVQSLA